MDFENSKKERQRHWPTPQDYQEAVQMPRVSLLDSELKNCLAATDALGLPRPRSGNFASVYEMVSDKQRFALRLFLQNIAGQEKRYAEISQFVMGVRFDEIVGFQYIADGIRIKSETYPILKMEWVDGIPLDQFVATRINEKAWLLWLVEQFVLMVWRLRDLGIAHGDFQHGNILVTPRGVKLVDYDGMYVPRLSGLPSNELGHRNFQHPKRAREHFGPYLDNFSAWVICAGLISITLDSDLWESFGGIDEYLLFRQADFVNPGSSRVLSALMKHESSAIRSIASQVIKNCQVKPEEIPTLSIAETTMTEIRDAMSLANRDDSVIKRLKVRDKLKNLSHGTRYKTADNPDIRTLDSKWKQE